MCGIVAVVDFRGRPVPEDVVIRLRDTMFHRGPDDNGVCVDGSIGVGHTRLSVIDLTRSGRQPMSNEDGSLQLIFNGEIYNYIELRDDLRRRGHVFSSMTDSEVILHQFEDDGARCVKKLRGMFSFAVWDRKHQRLFAARDRLGIKPLYYYKDQYQFILASEIKAIVEHPDVRRRVDMRAIADYFYAARPLGNRTMFEGIAELEPGHQLTVDRTTGALAIERYWDLSYNYNFSRPEDRTIEELAAIVDGAVSLHCRSDAPLGCHLSGGIDSSAVVAFAARHREHLRTFSIKFSDGAYVDETPYAKAVANRVGAEYLEWSPTASRLAELLPFLVWHMDMPTATEGAFAYFTVSDFAKNYVKVSLTGHGGDELFAGYPAQFLATFNTSRMFRLYRDPDRKSDSPGLLRRLVRKTPLGLYRSLRARTTGRTKSFEERWAELHCYYLPDQNPLLHPAFVGRLAGYSPWDAYVAPFARAGTDQTLDKCLYHDMSVYLPSLLHLEDRASMAVSLESRVPLLDHHVVEFLATVPPEQKVRGLRPKHLLRKIASPLLPEEVVENRDKRPFAVPGHFWKTKQMRELTKQVLLSKASIGREIIKPEVLRDACNDSAPVSLLWYLVNIELWFLIFVDQDRNWVQQATAGVAGLAS